MNKEQITFVVALLGLAAIHFLSGGSEAAKPRRTVRSNTEVSKPEVRQPFTPAADHHSWFDAGRNIYQAPRETENLPLVELGAPPFPRLVHPGLSLLLPLGPEARAKLRHAFEPDPKIVLPPPSGSVTTTVVASPEGGGASDDLGTVDRSAVGLTAAEKLRMSQEEQLKRKKAQDDAKRAEDERRRLMDKVTWLTGDMTYGIVGELDKKRDNRFQVKSDIEKVRVDSALSEDERKKKLEALKFYFYEDKGSGRQRARTTVSGNLVQKVEFAPTPLNRYGERRLLIAPNDHDAHEELARLVYDAGELEVAVKHLEEMRSKSLESARSWALEADANRRLFRYEKELLALERGLEKYPNDVALRARLGQLCLRLHLEQRARKSFEEALNVEPSNALSRLGLGELDLNASKFDDAINHLRQAETGSGLDKDQVTRCLVLLGEAFLAKNAANSAETYLSRVLDRDATNARALTALAVSAFTTGGADAALNFIKRGRDAHPLDGRLCYLEAIARLNKKEWVPGRDLLLLAKELDPLLSSAVHTGLSYIMEAVGQDGAALAEADLAVQADPLDLEARLQRARALLNVGDLARQRPLEGADGAPVDQGQSGNGAREEYERVLEGHPGRSDILVALGDTSFRSGNFTDAARFYARGSEKEPNFPDLVGRRLVCDVRRRRFADADLTMKRIDAALERNPFIQMAQAYFHYGKQNTDESVRRFGMLAEKRDLKTESPLQTYAAACLVKVQDNLNKEIWKDAFNRTGQILKGWKRDIGAGVNIALVDGRIRFEGTQKKASDEATVLAQTKSGRLFSSFQCDLDLPPQTGVYAGIGLIAFNQSARALDPWPGLQKREGNQYSFLGLQVVMSPEGKLVWRKITQGKATEWTEITGVALQGSGLNLAIEVQDSGKSLYRIRVDQQIVVENIDLPGLAKRAQEIEAQIFCQAQFDRPVGISADNVELIFLKRP